jgi:type IV pilus assembly protein PilF
MKKSNLIIPGAICLILMAGCISTTTGSITEPERDNKEAADLNYQLGARYYQKGSYNLALDRLLLATEFDPKRADAYSALALTYEALDNQRLAREAYENAIRVAPRDFEIQRLTKMRFV